MTTGAGDSTSPWAERSSDDFGVKARQTTEYEFLPQDEPTLVRFTGTCPACGHGFHFDWPLEIWRVAARMEPVVMCRCESETHAGRPKDITQGCGAYWVSRVSP